MMAHFPVVLVSTVSFDSVNYHTFYRQLIVQTGYGDSSGTIKLDRNDFPAPYIHLPGSGTFTSNTSPSGPILGSQRKGPLIHPRFQIFTQGLYLSQGAPGRAETLRFKEVHSSPSKSSLAKASVYKLNGCTVSRAGKHFKLQPLNWPRRGQNLERLPFIKVRLGFTKLLCNGSGIDPSSSRTLSQNGGAAANYTSVSITSTPSVGEPALPSECEVWGEYMNLFLYEVMERNVLLLFFF